MSVIRFPCLMYHHISEQGDRIKSKYCVPRAQFLLQLCALQNYGAEIHDMADLLQRKRCGGKLPVRYCVMTFDDGHISNLWAGEEIRKYGYHATFFVVKDWSENRQDYLGRSELKLLRAMGHSIGVHGKTHRWWTTLSDPELQVELAETKAWLEDTLQEPVEICAVPGGKINGRVRRMIAQAGFAMWGTSWSAMNRAKPLKSEINRIGISRNYSIARFMCAVRGNRALYLKYQARTLALWLPKHVLKR